MVLVAGIRSGLQILLPFQLECGPSGHLPRKIPREPVVALVSDIGASVSTVLFRVEFISQICREKKKQEDNRFNVWLNKKKNQGLTTDAKTCCLL